MSYYRRSRYFDTNYDQSTPVAQYLRERHKVNVAMFGFEPDLDPNPKSCKWCHEVLISAEDGANLMCQGCGVKVPLVPANQSQSQKQSEDKSSSKLKQKDSGKDKSFIITQSDDQRRQRRSGFDEETEEHLDALNYFSRLYGNVGDY